MRIIKKVGILMVVALIVGIFSNPVVAQEDVCEGLTGKAGGLCIAATQAANCVIEPSASTQACERLADLYRDATGEEPPWLVYDVGYEVSIYVNGILQFFTEFQLKSTTDAQSTQDGSGVVHLSTPLCDTDDPFSCSECAAVRAPLEGYFPAGTTVNFELLAINGLPNENAYAHCRLDRLPTCATIPGTAIYIPSDSNLGDNIVTLVADEPDGIVLHCEVCSRDLH